VEFSASSTRNIVTRGIQMQIMIDQWISSHGFEFHACEQGKCWRTILSTPPQSNNCCKNALTAVYSCNGWWSKLWNSATGTITAQFMDIPYRRLSTPFIIKALSASKVSHHCTPEMSARTLTPSTATQARANGMEHLYYISH